MNRLAVSGVIAVHTTRLASVSATSSPISAASAGDDIRPGADICSTSMKNRPGMPWSRPTARNSVPSTAGTTSITQKVAMAIRPGLREMVAQVGRIDAQERQRQHDDDGFAEERLAGGGEPRHGQADEQRRRHHQRALAAEQSERGRWQGEQIHCRKTPAARLGW